MRRCRTLPMLIAVAGLLAGCNGNTEKGINKHKDMPVPPTAEKQPREKK